MTLALGETDVVRMHTVVTTRGSIPLWGLKPLGRISPASGVYQLPGEGLVVRLMPGGRRPPGPRYIGPGPGWEGNEYWKE